MGSGVFWGAHTSAVGGQIIPPTKIEQGIVLTPCEALLVRVLQQELVSHMRYWLSWSFLLQHTTREFPLLGRGSHTKFL